jgi:hypothetical protein
MELTGWTDHQPQASAPNRYTWEIFRDHEILPMEEARARFDSWEKASQFGKNALKKLSAI